MSPTLFHLKPNVDPGVGVDLRPGSTPSPPPRARSEPTLKGGLDPELLNAASYTGPELLLHLQSSPFGLSACEVQGRRVRFGPNAVAHEKQENLLIQFGKRLLNPLNALLLCLATLAALTGDRRLAVMICAMVLLSLCVALAQERRSSRAAQKLRAMVHTRATVLRQDASFPAGSAEPSDVPIEDLVPGDIVHLSAGDLVPADVRLLSAKDLFINESTLTGEALPVEKHPEPRTTTSAQISDLTNVCLMGTSVVSGTASAVVVNTGTRAYFGGVAEVIARQRTTTSFDRGVSRFAWLMIRFIIVMAPLVFLINAYTKGEWLQALLFATAVAVGLTPEMLPMIVTVNLAKGALAMSTRKVIVKRLDAIQNFGAMDVLCTDKTGTLTQDRVILQKHVDLQGQNSAEVLELAYLNSRFQSGLHNLLDLAVLHHAESEALALRASVYQKLDEVPFDFERRRMSVAVTGDGKRLLICKGAVEEVFAVCSSGRNGDVLFSLEGSHLAELRETVAALNADGFRVIAIAYRELPLQQTTCTLRDESALTLMGYIAFLDPPKESAAAALRDLAAHGIRVKVLTGDNEVVTRKVCRDVELEFDRIVLGQEIAAMEPSELSAAVTGVHVFARLSPTQKSAVIQALQRQGHVVGFLGDGINDGPALKTADVGISVDSAVDIARESADIILLDKSLRVLDSGVTEGRRVFGNILKYIRMGASSNFGNMFSVIGASAWLPFLPMLPVQVLTNNLLYDISQTAIPSDNVDVEYLSRPRRWEIAHISRFMLLIGPISSIFDYATFALMYWGFGARTVGDAALFQTGWFVESLLSQTLIIHVIRTRHVVFVHSRASNALLITTALVCVAGALLPYSQLAPTLGFVPLPLSYWPCLAAMIILYLLLTHAAKVALQTRGAFD